MPIFIFFVLTLLLFTLKILLLILLFSITLSYNRFTNHTNRTFPLGEGGEEYGILHYIIRVLKYAI